LNNSMAYFMTIKTKPEMIGRKIAPGPKYIISAFPAAAPQESVQSHLLAGLRN
jgi:hypothetical protein